MAKNVGKILLLIIPCLITTCLLTYCLFSDKWLAIDSQRLLNVSQLFEVEFARFNNSGVTRIVHMVDKQQSQNNSPTTSSTTTISTTSTTIKSSSPVDSDYTDDDYTADESSTNDSSYKKKLKKKRAGKNENLFHSKSEDIDEIEDQDESEDETTTAKMIVKKKNDDRKVMPNDRIDFIYVTKLWPLVKSKSLYSQCVECHKFKLKISVSYLTSEKREPIVGELHYYDNPAYFSNDAFSGQSEGLGASAGNCNKKSMVYCQFTKTCKHGKSCDGVPDCEDQSDEQNCSEPRVCSFNNDITGFRCDSRCFQYWNKCDLEPHCFDLSDELSPDCNINHPHLHHHPRLSSVSNSTIQPSKPPTSSSSSNSLTSSMSAAILSMVNHDHFTFTLGHNHFDSKSHCFRQYFNFKSARLIKEQTLKYLSQPLADNIQATNNLNYHLHLLYTLSFLASLVFCVLALLSIMFVLCFGKLCFQCPFWFFGFFQILAWLSCLSGVITFLYQFYSDKQKSIDPLVQLPMTSEVLRLNSQLLLLEKLGLAFWFACAATVTAFIGSFLACVICCRLPSARHEDKEYKIMQLPTYS